MSAHTFRAPGRVNVIGDHVDYQDGLVLPMALHLETRATVSFGGDRVHLVSDRFADVVDVAADGSDGAPGAEPGWGRYVAGVVWALAAVGRPPVGMDGTVTSTVLPGVGLSSSAALEVAVAVALCAAAGVGLDPLALAAACQRAEAEGAGVPCGIMDQVVAVVGSPRGCLLLDCRSLRHEDVSLPETHVLVVVDSDVPRDLAASGYAARRREAEEAARALGIAALRDATLPMTAQLADPLRRRARHVVTENARVGEFVRALRNGRVETAGRLMSHSHRSLRDDFEVSHPDVDALVDELSARPGVLGARMTGGGFGGMVVALVERAQATAVIDAVSPHVAFVAEPALGAGAVEGAA